MQDTFLNAKPVTGGIGKALLTRMGWKEGEGLGRNSEGITAPILVDIKMDRKGAALIKLACLVNFESVKMPVCFKCTWFLLFFTGLRFLNDCY